MNIKKELKLMYKVGSLQVFRTVLAVVSIYIFVDCLGYKGWKYQIVYIPISFMIGFIGGRIMNIYKLEEK